MYEVYLHESIRSTLIPKIHGRDGALVVAEFKRGLIEKRPPAIGGAASVVFPAIGNFSEFVFSGEAMHDAQLHDVQTVIEIARHHGQAGAGLLVERPESEVESVEVVEQGLNCACE